MRGVAQRNVELREQSERKLDETLVVGERLVEKRS